MSDSESQDEEREVLASIYDGDTNFKQVSPTKYQYKYGENEGPKSFLLELSWGPTYPTTAPIFNLDTFYNRNIIPSVKESIIRVLSDEAEQWLGCAMTYTLFECLKEQINELLANQPEIPLADIVGAVDNVKLDDDPDGSKKGATKKQQLTKSQKRRQWDRVDNKGERARGWDWVDIVKHLSQTGYKDDDQTTS